MTTAASDEAIMASALLAGNSIARDRSAHECANCGRSFTGAFCPECGQRASDVRRPFVALIFDGLSDFFAIDARWLRTLKWLALRPGKLALDYVSGQRVRFTPPTRTFVFALLAVLIAGGISAFLNSTVFSEDDQTNTTEIEFATSLKSAFQRADARLARLAGQVDGEQLERVNAAREALAETASSVLGHDFSSTRASDVDFEDAPPWVERLEPQLKNVIAAIETEPERFVDRFAPWFPRSFAIMAFLMAPLSALLFWGRYLSEHVIFSLYLHSGLATFTALGSLFTAIPYGGFVVALFFIAAPFYIIHAMRQFYASGRFTTSLRLIILGLLYLTVWALVLLAALIHVALSLAA